MSWSSDGRYLATSTGESVSVWRLPEKDLIRANKNIEARITTYEEETKKSELERWIEEHLRDVLDAPRRLALAAALEERDVTLAVLLDGGVGGIGGMGLSVGQRMALERAVGRCEASAASAAKAEAEAEERAAQAREAAAEAAAAAVAELLKEKEARARQPPLAFSRAVPKGVSVSADGLAVSRVGSGNGWQGAVVEPAVSSAERCYAEWVIEEADADCCIMIGVTALDAAPPAGKCMYAKPGSRMYWCYNSKAFLGDRNWGAAGRRAQGERVGVLVERGSVWVYANGARLGPGPMATDLPPRVRFAVEMFNPGSRLRLIPGAAPPAA